VVSPRSVEGVCVPGLDSSWEAPSGGLFGGLEDAKPVDDGSGPSMMLYRKRQDGRRIAFQSPTARCGRALLPVSFSAPPSPNVRVSASAESHADSLAAVKGIVGS